MEEGGPFHAMGCQDQDQARASERASRARRERGDVVDATTVRLRQLLMPIPIPNLILILILVLILILTKA